MTYRYPSANTSAPPKAVIVYFHGYGSHISTAAYIAKYFSDLHYDVIGFDFKGHGLSGGTRALISSSEEFIADGVNFVRKAREFYKEKYPETKLAFVAYGDSMGCTA